jgi:hypothetical protein
MLPPSSQSAGRLELAGLPRDVALRGPFSIRDPLSRSRQLFSPGLLPVTETRVDGLALLDRELQAGEPLEALDPEQVRAGRSALQAALQDSVDLVLGTRA